MFIKSILISILIININCEVNSPEKVIEMLKNDKVIPDAIDASNGVICNIKYPTGVYADLGSVIFKEDVIQQPKVFWNSNDDELYTLLMVCPDVPSRKDPHLRSSLNWLVINAKGSAIETGETVASYLVNPPENLDDRRYVIVIYKQKTPLVGVKYIEHNDDRFHFNATVFASKYNLGDPIAVNYFYSTAEENDFYF